MKRGLLFVAAIAMLFTSVGCHHNVRQNGCQQCQHSHGGGRAGAYGNGYGSVAARRADQIPRAPHGYHRELYDSQGAPATPQVAYPYYTTRAPRDFLLDNPPSIGY